MKMLVFFGVLVFAGASKGSLTRVPVCMFNQTGPCYGAVGHPLYLQMGPESRVDIKKLSDVFIKIRDRQMVRKYLDYLRWRFVSDNRTVIINRTEKRDSATYTLETYSKGAVKGIYHLQLVTEDVVSSVEVTYSCSSSEKRRVYCSSDGENVTYSWTFRGTPHTDQLADGNQTLLLDKESVGSVTCYAQNHVSQEHKTIQLDPCPGTTTKTPTTAVKTTVTQPTQSLGGKSLIVTVNKILIHNRTVSSLSVHRTTTKTPTTAVKTTVTQPTQSLGGTTTKTPTTTVKTTVTQPTQSLGGTVFVCVWVLEMMFLMSVLGGFHIYARIRRNQIKREEENKEKVEEALYTNIGQEGHQRDG